MNTDKYSKTSLHEDPKRELIYFTGHVGSCSLWHWYTVFLIFCPDEAMKSILVNNTPLPFDHEPISCTGNGYSLKVIYTRHSLPVHVTQDNHVIDYKRPECLLPVSKYTPGLLITEHIMVKTCALPRTH